MKLFRLIIIFSLAVGLYSCAPKKFSFNQPLFTFVKKKPANKLYLIKKPDIVLAGGEFSKAERATVIQRLYNQLDDSSKITIKDAFFIFHTIKNPPAYDSGYSAVSAANMRGSMFHLGYYNSTVTFDADTSGRKVIVRYTVTAGKPTRIDTVSYSLKKPALQTIAINSRNESLLVQNNPITKPAVLAEVSRLVDSFRNAGYYKFTAAELKVRGDTTIEALTAVTDDPFEQLRLLNEAQQKRDSPTIKLNIVLNKPEDSTKLNQYRINKIYILSDFRPNDLLSDTINITQQNTRNFIRRYHEKLFRSGLFTRNITMRTGDLFRQDEYYQTLTNLSGLGVWQSVNIRIIENLDETNKVDLVIELLPAKKFSFESALEASYSASSNTTSALGGNLFGFSTTFSLTNRNFAKEAIRMTHNLRLGIELNNKARNNATNLINSNEISYSNNVTIPRLLILKSWGKKGSQSFINTSLGYNNRLNLFSLQSFNASFGETFVINNNSNWSLRLPNVEFNYLFNQSDSFKNILSTNPFLRYSYNTAFILGIGGSYSNIRKTLTKERSIHANAEESGTTIGLLPIVEKYKKHYIKLDAEYKKTITQTKTEWAYRFFAGVGIPLKGDTALPFFKQYYGGGSNSMRGWPVRGIGRGAQKLIPFAQNIFNDRTGDIQFEANIEFRHDIARLIPDLLTLKGGLFADAGNIWNFKDSRPGGVSDMAQFKFKNFYKELGLSAGYGFRFDFSYLTLRTDFGFRFKRPESSDVNAGWKAPSIGFDDFFQKLFYKKYREWRYENFNFTIGINKAF